MTPDVTARLLGVDRAFTGLERAALADAVAILDRESRGCARFVLVDDSEAPLFVVRNVKTDKATREAETHFGMVVYGWTGGSTSHLDVTIHRDARGLAHTAMHEFLHLLGVHHTAGDARAVMAPGADASTAPLHLAWVDLVAVAEATGCMPW